MQLFTCYRLFLTALLFGCTTFPLFAINSDSQKPNVLFILVDDMGFGDLSSHGAPHIKSPNIDDLMKSGLRFDNFYANSCVCSPTRASLMTGLYPDKAGVPGVIRLIDNNSWGYLNPDIEILPSLLQRTGYQTALIGKWHLGHQKPNLPNQRGFDLFRGFRGGMVMDYYTHQEHGSKASDMWYNTKPVTVDGHCTDLFSDWAVEYLEQSARHNHPFFLYLPYNAPHTPIQPPEEWVHKVKARYSDISDRDAKYVALVEHLDEGIGRVIKALKATGQAENTLVVFTSDNGGFLQQGAYNGSWRGGKQDVYEGGLRVPACVVWPGKIQAGTRTSLMALTMDFFPTLCELTGVNIPHRTDGVSLLPTLMGQPQAALRKEHYFVRREGNTRYNGLTIQALQAGDYKILQNSPFAAIEMYNLKKDPQEQTDLSKKEPKRTRDMMTLMRKHIQDGGRVPWMRRESRFK